MRLATATLSVVVLLAACQRPDDALARLCSWFGITGARTTAELRTRLLTVFPPGTPREEIVGRLATAGVRKAGGNVQEEPPGRTIFLRTGGVQRAFVLHEFALAFSFGPDDRLIDIKVEEWRTGP